MIKNPKKMEFAFSIRTLIKPLEERKLDVTDVRGKPDLMFR